MIHLAIDLVGGVVLFALGIAAANSTNPTVERAVKAIEAAETDAINTLTKIGQHKSGTTAPVTVSVVTDTPKAA